MQITMQVLDPAPDHDLVSLYDAKLALNLPMTDTSRDQQLALFIRWASGEIEAQCNRIFAKERVSETFREIMPNVNKRIFLTHYPVEQKDIESVTFDGGTELEYDLDSRSGTLYAVNGAWTEPVTVVYTGGYEVPEKSPLAVQQACLLIARETYIMAIRGLATSGVRMIAHKESRIMYYDPNAALGGAGGGTLGLVGSATKRAVLDLLRHFMRFPV